jgi:hypothetical protein
LLIDFYPSWLLDERIQPSPRDERFVGIVESSIGWDLRTWWYESANFGGIGLAVRAIAETWGLSIERTVALMEPLDLREDEDRRVVLPIHGRDEGVRVTAIRMKRPER